MMHLMRGTTVCPSVAKLSPDGSCPLAEERLAETVVDFQQDSVPRGHGLESAWHATAGIVRVQSDGKQFALTSKAT